MDQLFWEIFKKSGDIDAFMAYKEYKNKPNFYGAVDQFYIDKIRNQIH